MKNNESISTAAELQQLLFPEFTSEGFGLLLEQGLPVFLVSEEYCGLSQIDRRLMMSTIIGLLQIQKRIDSAIEID